MFSIFFILHWKASCHQFCYPTTQAVYRDHIRMLWARHRPIEASLFNSFPVLRYRKLTKRVLSQLSASITAALQHWHLTESKIHCRKADSITEPQGVCLLAQIRRDYPQVKPSMHLCFDDSSQSDNVPLVGIRKHRSSFTAIVPSISLFAHQSNPQDSESTVFSNKALNPRVKLLRFY